MNKRDGTDGLETVHDVAKRFVSELGGERTKLAEQKVATTPNVVQYNDDGSPMSTGMLAVETAGFSEGMTAKNKESGELHVIKSISSDGCVTLTSLHTSAITEVQSEEFINAYRISSETFQVFDAWESQAPSNQVSYQEHVLRASIAVALASLAKETELAKLRLVLKPSRSVFAESAYNVGKLTLVPETTKVVFDDRSTSALKGVAGGKDFYLLPTFTETFAAPAWIVKPTADADVANMKASTRKVTVAVESGETVALIPVVTNSKKIKVGDELFVFREASAKVAMQTKRTLNLKVEAPKSKAKAVAKKK
jgi:hypothetical protein